MRDTCSSCDGVILADTENWSLPRCYDCFALLGEPTKEPVYREASRILVPRVDIDMDECPRRYPKSNYVFAYDYLPEVGGSSSERHVLVSTDSGSISDLVDEFKNYLKAIGSHEKTINEFIPDDDCLSEHED